MDKLVTLQEVQALTSLLNKCTMSPAEAIWANAFTRKLFDYASQKPEPNSDDSIQERENELAV